MIAEAVKHMLAAGMPHEAIVAAVADMEASQPKDRAAENRRAYDRERKRLANSTGIPPESAECVESLILEVSPHTPLPNPDLDIPPYSPPNSGKTDEPATPVLLPEHVVDFWNENAASFGLPTATLTPKRRKALQSRIRQHGVDDWTEAIGAIQRSPFLRGENDRGWRANIDFLLRADSITKLKEGVYDGSAH